MKYQTIFIQSNFLKKYDLKYLYEHLNENGVLFILMENEQNKDYSLNTFRIMEELETNGFIFKNMVLWVNRFEQIKAPLYRLYKNLLFYVKSENYYFNKDEIREKHIWKDIEWGKRDKNYNPKGKDPGDVWIKTVDDGKGRIIGYVPLNFEQVVERVILSTSKEKDTILIISNKKFKDLNKQKRNVMIKNG